jgi:RNA polymerase-binding transcription factor DksA
MHTDYDVADKLKKRLAELTGRLEGIEEQLEDPHSADFGERAIETEGDEVLEGIGRAGLAEIAAIRAALLRLETGNYGVCKICGGEISAERLKAVPHAAICRKCFTAG